jgi:deoxyribodipyrimidine photo-lyase
MSVSRSRITVLHTAAPNPRGHYVLYWMTAARRACFNFALDRALELARELNRPILVLEALRIDYAWASERIHAFVLEGMRDNARAFARPFVHYYPYVEPRPGAGRGLLSALAEHACAVVTDDSPAFFLPRMRRRAATEMRVLCEAVDGNGLLPLSLAAGKSFVSAYSFRRFLQQNLERALCDLPAPAALRRAAKLPRFSFSLRAIERRYPRFAARDIDAHVAALAIDHEVRKAPDLRGGHGAARARLDAFLAHHLSDYAEGRNHPDRYAQSGLSPYLHFGHLGTHEVFHALCESEGWDGMPRGEQKRGTRHGFWGLSINAESFLDELVTWRELSFNAAATLPHYERYDSLPDWAKKTLERHREDVREVVYSLSALERAKTHDPIWNAAQTELVRDGRMHNYLRMLWGKKILEWSTTPKVALKRMIQLNNKYALDGRDPNSYAGIFWVLGRYDRPWGPERPIFGTVRFMSSAATKRKLDLSQYLARYGA